MRGLRFYRILSRLFWQGYNTKVSCGSPRVVGPIHIRNGTNPSLTRRTQMRPRVDHVFLRCIRRSVGHLIPFHSSHYDLEVLPSSPFPIPLETSLTPHVLRIRSLIFLLNLLLSSTEVPVVLESILTYFPLRIRDWYGSLSYLKSDSRRLKSVPKSLTTVVSSVVFFWFSISPQSFCTCYCRIPLPRISGPRRGPIVLPDTHYGNGSTVESLLLLPLFVDFFTCKGVCVIQRTYFTKFYLLYFYILTVQITRERSRSSHYECSF